MGVRPSTAVQQLRTLPTRSSVRQHDYRRVGRSNGPAMAMPRRVDEEVGYVQVIGIPPPSTYRALIRAAGDACDSGCLVLGPAAPRSAKVKRVLHLLSPHIFTDEAVRE